MGSVNEKVSSLQYFLQKLLDEKEKTSISNELRLSNMLLDEAICIIQDELIHHYKEDKQHWLKSSQLGCTSEEPTLSLALTIGPASSRPVMKHDKRGIGPSSSRPCSKLTDQFNTCMAPKLPQPSLALPKFTDMCLAPKPTQPSVSLIMPPPYLHPVIAHEKQGKPWKSGLHDQFMVCVDQLGGLVVATPTDIRARMLKMGKHLTVDDIELHLNNVRVWDANMASQVRHGKELKRKATMSAPAAKKNQNTDQQK